MNRILKAFFDWYERNLTLNLSITAFLFSWQIVHLSWLFAHVIWVKLFGYALWNPNDFWERFIILVDFTEIPAIISVGLVFINDLRKKFKKKEFLYLFFLGSQVLHIFWITDEFVLEAFGGNEVLGMVGFLAWVAILIDFLEVPVIIETYSKLVKSIQGGKNKLA